MPDAPQEICELVAIFQRNQRYYIGDTYNEAQVRAEFIDKFFIALGWDVANIRGYAPQFREVLTEAALGGKQGAATPDYTFRHGSDVLFFVEAKKPQVRIAENAQAAFQLRRYAWSKGLKASILTDFQEFAVYDCQLKPSHNDRASDGRVLLATCDEYPVRWGEIASIFAREAVLKGEFANWAATNTGKHGTQTVDAAFLADMSAWRELLARNLALRNPALTEGDLNYAVQMTLDRIVFLRICEDRGIEPYGVLRDAALAREIYPRLLELFRAADQRYNSGLFHLAPERGREQPDTLTPSLKLDDPPLKEIIGKLYWPSPYDFNQMPVEILGRVYEQFLGSVIRLTPAHQAKVEVKPEVRKAGGVYYTPQYIVRYIVEHTVGELLKDKSPAELLDLAICDPACGSGSFLLGAYEYLLSYYLNWYVAQPDARKRRELRPAAGGGYELALEEKKRILTRHIYGVDIDQQAVEVTKLSLLLKVLEGESEGSMQLKLLQERALPDLAHNIRCGNSLIGWDYPNASSLSSDDLRRINPFDWQKAFPQVFARGGFDAVIGNPPYIRIQMMKEWAPQEVGFYKQRYMAASKGNYDIYVVFVEKGLSLLNEHGHLGFILPHKFFNAQYGESLRKLIAEGRHLTEVVHFGDQQIFINATTYTCLMFLSKSSVSGCAVYRVDDLNAWRAEGKASYGIFNSSLLSSNEWVFTVGGIAALLTRLTSMPFKLGGIAHIYVGVQTSADPVFLLQVKENDTQEVLVYSRAINSQFTLEASILKPVLKGSEIRRYNINQPDNLLLFPYKIVGNQAIVIEQTELSKYYPKTWQYLLKVKALLEARDGGKWLVPQWWQFGRNQNIAEMSHPKILTQVLSRAASYSLDDQGLFAFVGGGNAGGYAVSLNSSSSISESYLLGLLNSKLLDRFLQSISSAFRGGYFSHARRFIEQLPIRTIDFSSPADVARHDQMVQLVERMLQLHKDLAAATTPHYRELLERQISATDAAIDRLVYELYDLTAEEIALVEVGG